MKSKILLIDDDKELVSLLAKRLEKNNFIILKAHSYKEGLELFFQYKNNIAVAIIDIKLLDGNGLKLSNIFKKINSDCELIIMTGIDLTIYQIEKLLKAGMRDIIKKPFELYDFVNKVENAYELYISKEKIKYNAYHDTLTGVYNRAYFEEELKRINTSRNYPLGVIIADINKLKVINDTLGHIGGDHVIIAIANGMKTCIRQDDMLARIGGDEFVILLKNITPDIINNLISRIKQNCVINLEKSHSLKITCSIGYVLIEKQTDNLESYIIEADKKMYREKKQHHENM